MKQLKKLTRTQKEILSQHEMDWDEWGLVPEAPNKKSFTVQHRVNKTLKTIEY